MADSNGDNINAAFSFDFRMSWIVKAQKAISYPIIIQWKLQKFLRIFQSCFTVFAKFDLRQPESLISSS